MSLSVVVAPDSFKGTLSARAAAEAIAAGWRAVRPNDTVTSIAQADGGEGTLDAIEAAVAGSVRRDAGLVTGPDGRAVPGYWLELPNGSVVVELALVSGLPLMLAPDPRGATTRGLGEVISMALATGPSSLVVALGGSASTDGGAGALSALGLRMTDAAGATLADGGAALAALGALDASALAAPPAGGVVLLSDVTAPLLGPAGAAAVFGPQKGATAADVVVLDAALARFAAALGGDAELPGTGAAGGVGFGLSAAWGATIVPGADFMARLTGLDAAMGDADVVLTGEGRFDAQSMRGKVVGQLLRRAGVSTDAAALAGGTSARHPAVGIIAGEVDASTLVRGEPVWCASLVELAGSRDAALRHPSFWLRKAGERAARHFGS